MTRAAIIVEHLSKHYLRGARPRNSTVADTISSFFRAPLQFARQSRASTSFWALRDVSVEVNQGEVVGIIGRNGAGKSTLLKILSRITAPTEGRASIRGRVASLLEVGTGFHHELTGRENIYMNGSLLGMTRTEINRKFDQIVDFAGVSDFLDTPVKRYSSGMSVRLAFSVAAHLDAEVLIVDEVLAVGDMAFQKMCLGRMNEVVRSGRTVLFVSHNLGIIANLCNRCLYLESGMPKKFGPTSEVVADYIAGGSRVGARVWEGEPAAGQPLVPRALVVKTAAGQEVGTVRGGETVAIELAYDINRPIGGMRVVFTLLNAEGTIILAATDSGDTIHWHGRDREPGRYVARCEFPGRLLNEGTYIVSVGADIPHVGVLFHEDAALRFDIEQAASASGERWPGLICPELVWTERQR